MEHRPESEPAGLILARCAEILEQVDDALAAGRLEEMPGMLAESRIRLSELSSGISVGVDPSNRGAYADLAAERARLRHLLRRTEEILDRCRRRRCEGLEELRLLRTGQTFCDGDCPDNGGWTDMTC